MPVVHFHRAHHVSRVERAIRSDESAQRRRRLHLKPPGYYSGFYTPPPAGQPPPGASFSTGTLLRLQRQLDAHIDHLDSQPDSYVNGESNQHAYARDDETNRLQRELRWVRRQLHRR